MSGGPGGSPGTSNPERSIGGGAKRGLYAEGAAEEADVGRDRDPDQGPERPGEEAEAELDRLIENFFTADRIREFETLDDMLAEFRGNETLYPQNVNMVYVHEADWRRKAAHGGTQSWYALINEMGVSVFVVCHMVGRNGAQGYKAWSLNDGDFEQAMANYM